MKVGIIGASGYTGAELLRLLLRHPEVEVSVLVAERHAGRSLQEVFPSFRGLDLPRLEPFDPEVVASKAELFFSALPHGTSAQIVKALLERGKRVIDLSADFRFRDPGLYERWYSLHPHPELLSEAVYGLPELYRSLIREAKLVANPGCYPTGALLALLPLAEEGLLAERVVVDAKSGVSGAGRSPTQGTHFCEVSEATRAYNVLRHRHTPEMEQQLKGICKREVEVIFTPHLVPMNRGILSTVYADLQQEVPVEELHDLYRQRYCKEPFVRVCPLGTYPSTSDVRGTNFCDIGIGVKGSLALVVSAIDNLTKGASGQALQSMNIMLGLPEISGLQGTALFP